MAKALKFLAFFAIAVCIADACGVTTHNVISNTAFEKILNDPTINYKDIIRNNRNYFQSGSAFPDWGYQCPLGMINDTLADILHNAAESAHWINFMRTGINYLNTTYQRPWNTDAQRLLAFLLGVVSHSVADILWHDIGVIGATRQGFIQAMCESDFNCSSKGYDSNVHFLADAGGEFVNAKFYDLSFIEQDWALPYTDIVNIYKLLGMDISQSELVICFAVIGIEIDFVSDINPNIVYPYFASQSSFLVNSMHDWWLGGIQSMAFWTQNCWTGIVEYLDTGNFNAICGLYKDSGNIIQSRKDEKSRYHQLKRNFMKSMMERNSYQTELKSQKQPTLQTDMKCTTNYTNKFDSPFVGSMFSYSFDVSDDHVLVGAPFDSQNQGAVSLLALNRTLRSQHVKGVRTDKNDDSRFGSNVKFIDINNDGIHDAVVNEPGFNNFMGRTHIFLSMNSTLNLDYSNVITIGHVGDSWGSMVHLANGDYDGDGVDDLLMGFSQYRSGKKLEIGVIIVILASANWTSGDLVVCDNTQCNSTRVIVKSVGSVFWEQAGAAIKAIRFEGRSYVLVSSPTFNLGQGAIGKVACWDLVNDQVVWELYGPELNSGFGSSLESDDTNIYIGAPNHDAPRVVTYQGGSVFVYRLADLFDGQKNPLTAIHGGDSFSRFGQALAISNGSLYVSAPFTKDISGIIYAYDVEEFKPTGCYAVDGKSHTALGYKLKVKNGVIYAGAPHQDNFSGGLYTFSL